MENADETLSIEAPQIPVEPGSLINHRSIRKQFRLVTLGYRELAKLGRKPSRQTIRTALERVLKGAGEAPSTIEHLLLGWLYDLAINGGLSGGRLTTSSLRRYFAAARYPILAACQDVDVASLDGRGWIGRLQQAIDRAHDRMTPGRVLSFARFIQRRVGGPRLDLGELEVDGAPGNVRATLVTPTELELALRRVRGDSSFIDMATLVISLVYYCGLRPDDAIHLRLCDIHGYAAPEILIRPHVDYDPKTLSAVRRVPAKALLPFALTRRLVAWVRRRVAEAGDESSVDLVFASPEAPRRPLTAGILYDQITQALREVTGDDSVTFYSLRHSFGTITLFRLLAADNPRLLPSQYALFREDCFSPEACRTLKVALAVRLMPWQQTVFAKYPA